MNKILKITENMINSIGKIKAPVNVPGSELSFSVNPKVNLSQVNLKDFHIEQIDVSDTEIGIKFNKEFEVPGDLEVSFGIDSKIKDWTKTIDKNGTRFSFDIAATDINQDIKMYVKLSDSVMSIVSPSGTNDFQMTVGGNIKL